MFFEQREENRIGAMSFCGAPNSQVRKVALGNYGNYEKNYHFLSWKVSPVQLVATGAKSK